MLKTIKTRCAYESTCEKADNQAYENDYKAVECTVPHVGQ